MTGADRQLEPLGGLVRVGALDAELAALVSLLVGAHVPVVVAGPEPSPRAAVRDALVALVPALRVMRLAGPDERFDWMPEAAALGWQTEPGGAVGVGSAAPSADAPRLGAERTVLVADLVPDGPSATWGERARLVVRSLSVGYGMLAIAGGERLEVVLGRLAAPPVGALDDELTRLGLVLIMGADDDRLRVAAAHYLRPVARDVQGHVQRLAPAVIAVWEPRSGRFEHFAWGILDELAGRLGMSPAELEREQARRMARFARSPV